jgi:protein arginine kinase activator
MICELCKKKNATVHLTEAIKDQMKELHLCEVCARQQGLVHKFTLTINDLLQKLVPPKGPQESKKFEGLACPQCGLTYAEFRARGRFGCPHDVVAFEEGLEPLLEKIHGATRHVGRIPGQSSESVKLQERLAKLRRDLEEMKKQENYERCAELRDQINTLEEKLRL